MHDLRDSKGRLFLFVGMAACCAVPMLLAATVGAGAVAAGMRGLLPTLAFLGAVICVILMIRQHRGGSHRHHAGHAACCSSGKRSAGHVKTDAQTQEPAHASPD
ncbi:MAG: hypothetical protein KatS3mg008_1673 [Acidimicrobiales bacterium]|nr:MAG: hypothetical protein KatS3mg008_1673 [Acidimicrobiales bacterium]